MNELVAFDRTNHLVSVGSSHCKKAMTPPVQPKRDGRLCVRQQRKRKNRLANKAYEED